VAMALLHGMPRFDSLLSSQILMNFVSGFMGFWLGQSSRSHHISLLSDASEGLDHLRNQI
jgi:hypothetical protein